MDYKLKVTEQNPVGNSIFCTMRCETENGSSIRYGRMEFVCNLDREITQWYEWLQYEPEIISQLKELGYSIEYRCVRCAYCGKKLYVDSYIHDNNNIPGIGYSCDDCIDRIKK